MRFHKRYGADTYGHKDAHAHAHGRAERRKEPFWADKLCGVYNRECDGDHLAYADTHRDIYKNVDFYFYRDGDGHIHGNLVAHADPDFYGICFPDIYPDSHAYFDFNAYPYPDLYKYKFADFYRDLYPDIYPNVYFNSYAKLYHDVHRNNILKYPH